MSIQIGVNFEYKGKLSNFARDSFETLTDMRNVLDNDIDKGHISYCVETGKHYTFNRNNAIDVITGKWRLLTENPEDLKSVLNLKADKSELDTKVDKVDGKSLISDTEIARLATINNYDDTDIKNTINNKANTTDLTTHTSDTSIHITSAERTKWNNKAEMTDIPNLTNYATKTYVTDEIAKASTSGTVDLTGYAKTADVNAGLSTKVDKVTGKSLISDAEITRLSKISNYDDSSIKSSIANMNSELAKKANKSELFSKSYNDLTDKPIIPSLDGYAKLTDIPDITGKADKTYVDTKLNTKANKSELFSGSYNDLTDKPAIPSLDGYATKTYVTDEINKASLSGTVDLTAYAKTVDVNTSLSNKVDKVDGKGLSTNDYTADEKTKVGKIKTDGNGKELLANNGNYVGIYSKKEIDDLLYPILNPYKAPIVNLSASDTLFKVGTTNLVTFTADITKGRDDIKSIKFVDGTDTILKEITDKTELAKTTQTYTLSMTTTGTVKVIVSDGISAVEKSVTVTYTYDSYYGIISADKTSLTSDEIKSLNTKLTTDKSFKYDKINLDNQKIAYAYLKSRGALTKILDANNFDYLNSYTRSEVNIDGQEYYLYILTKATVIDGFKQIYQ